MEDLIYTICGKDGDISVLNDIGNNPNYVFTIDPTFKTITLFNDLGSIINVNSWIECANYVNGGWISDNIDLFNGEKKLFFIGTFGVIIYFFIKIYFKRSRALFL